MCDYYRKLKLGKVCPFSVIYDILNNQHYEHIMGEEKSNTNVFVTIFVKGLLLVVTAELLVGHNGDYFLFVNVGEFNILLSVDVDVIIVLGKIDDIKSIDFDKIDSSISNNVCIWKSEVSCEFIDLNNSIGFQRSNDCYVSERCCEKCQRGIINWLSKNIGLSNTSDESSLVRYGNHGKWDEPKWWHIECLKNDPIIANF